MHNVISTLASLLLIVFLAAQTAQATPLSEQRRLYDQAKNALAKGNSSVYLNNRQALSGYPLEPYLAFDELMLRLPSASDSEIDRFLIQHGDVPQASRMKLRWMRQLASRGDWNTFNRHYEAKQEITELDCLHAEYLIRKGQAATGYAAAEKLWLTGKSQPNGCDSLFALYRTSGQLTGELVWKRMKLAAEAGNYGLITHLTRNFPALAQDGQTLIAVAKTPGQLSQTDRYKQATRHNADIVSIGLRRLARQDPEKALNLLDVYSKALNFSDEEKVAIASSIGLTLARRFDPRALPIMAQYDPNLKNDTVSEWRLRLLLRLGRWQEAHDLTKKLPAKLADTNRWKYWRARSLQLLSPNHPESMTLYQQVANERDFYGYLASDQLKTPYKMAHKPVQPSAAVMQQIQHAPATKRAQEFFARGEVVNARREFYHAANRYDREQLIAQSKLAYEMRWYFPAIRSISMAKYWDDLDIRFPIAHRDILTREARNRGLDTSWVFAITRQESAFMSDARSHAGATGLMQLMPATARETSQKFGIPMTSTHDLISPELNIKLGTAYLSHVSNQFNGNRVLASAAYNAGPGRVRQWLRNTRNLAVDIWVENIPFDETRQYVQNVMTYSVIYGEKLNKPRALIDWHERYIEGI